MANTDRTGNWAANNTSRPNCTAGYWWGEAAAAANQLCWPGREGDTIFRNGRCVHQLHELTNMPPGTSKPRHERCIQESYSESLSLSVSVSVCLIEWDECSRSLCKRNLLLVMFPVSSVSLRHQQQPNSFVLLDGLAHYMQTRYIMLWADCTCTTYLLKCFNAVWRLSFFLVFLSSV